MTKPSGRKGRKINTRDSRPRILIVCEGEKTEPNYFRAFPVTGVVVEIRGAGMNTTGLVQEAKRIARREIEADNPFNEVWLVFDKDDFSSDHFHTAITAAESHSNWNVAWSNQSFELWYLLHFLLISAAIDRATVIKKLDGHMQTAFGFRYTKNNATMYDTLRERQTDALTNAQVLENQSIGQLPAERCPCTMVHHLVKRLNEQIR